MPAIRIVQPDQFLDRQLSPPSADAFNRYQPRVIDFLLPAARPLGPGKSLLIVKPEPPGVGQSENLSRLGPDPPNSQKAVRSGQIANRKSLQIFDRQSLILV